MTAENQNHLVLDIETIRKNARTGLDAGAVTRDYAFDTAYVVKLLDASLSTEIVCSLRYKRHAFLAAARGGIPGFAIADELMTHAKEEESHADRLAERIVQLGGDPTFDPAVVATRSHVPYAGGNTLQKMLEEDLVAERIAIETYRALASFLGDRDPTSRRLIEGILEQEEEHADDVSDALRRLTLDVGGAQKR